MVHCYSDPVKRIDKNIIWNDISIDNRAFRNTNRMTKPTGGFYTMVESVMSSTLMGCRRLGITKPIIPFESRRLGGSETNPRYTREEGKEEEEAVVVVEVAELAEVAEVWGITRRKALRIYYQQI